jgi:hypothetical protein
MTPNRGAQMLGTLYNTAEENIMRQNEGSLDRTLRVIVGIALIAMVFVGPKAAWGWIGIVPLLTGLVGVCPLYRLIGMSTCPRR